MKNFDYFDGPETPFFTSKKFNFESNMGLNGLYLLGFGFDKTACFRKGASKGPLAIRECSPHIESYSPYLHMDLEDFSSFYDLGDLVIDHDLSIQESYLLANDHFQEFFSAYNFSADPVKTLVLGGDHSISLAPIEKYLNNFPDLLIIHLDAHADLRDGYEGHHYSHASIIRRALDSFEKGHSLIQYGIRSGTKEEFSWMSEKGTLKTSLQELLSEIELVSSTRPIYLTLDVDFFDPGVFPGTGTPEPGGASFSDFIKIMKLLRTKKFVGADITELSPELDPTGVSSVFAASLVRETALTLMGTMRSEEAGGHCE
jgi:agmatinase